MYAYVELIYETVNINQTFHYIKDDYDDDLFAMLNYPVCSFIWLTTEEYWRDVSVAGMNLGGRRPSQKT